MPFYVSPFFPPWLILLFFPPHPTKRLGNEAGPGTLYSFAALIADIPPLSERTKILESLSEDVFRGAFVQCIFGADPKSEMLTFSKRKH